MPAPQPGIPTLYRSIRFRSRLEATWAAWFDKVQWPWSYEPYDLDGYIPDFILRFHQPAHHVMVEVKPVLEFAELAAFAPRLEAVGWGGTDILVLGAHLFTDPSTGQPILGWLGEAGYWAGAPLGFCHECGAVTFCHEEQSFTGRSCGCYPGGCWPRGSADDLRVLNTWWHEAKNAMQWRP